jgi:bacterioferritin
MEHGSEFIVDIQALRARAREHLEEGARTESYGGSVEKAVEILNAALATELICVLRYKFHWATAQGIDSESIKAEFAEHARDELEHADMLAERIAQLGGRPDFDPEGLSSRAHTQYMEGADLLDMVREDLVAERIAIDSYRAMIRYFGEDDPTTRRMLETILAKEEEHANDMQDLLLGPEEPVRH